MSNEGNNKLSARECCIVARKIWLCASEQSDLAEVERYYRRALRAQKTPSKKDRSRISKKAVGKLVMELSRKEFKDASDKLALLLCQQGRSHETKRGLEMLGYKCRLSDAVLNYTYPVQPMHRKAGKGCPCVILDDFLSKLQLKLLQKIFSNTESSYWLDHNYSIEPPSPYFSYAFSLEHVEEYGLLGDLVQRILQLPEVKEKFPAVKEAKYAEMWAHNRPHASGHQLHFDSDDEGRGDVIKNPIISTVIYLSDDCGGPSLVTNQPFSSGPSEMTLATHGWLSYPQRGRLVAFDGKLLHGVIPGKGTAASLESRRVTLMIALWKDLKIRIPQHDDTLGGAARPFPHKGKSQWVKEIMTLKKHIRRNTEITIETKPVPINGIYETLDGSPWTSHHGPMEYDEVFQGF